jgi:trigger factor
MPGFPGAMEDPVLREKAEQEAERLLEELKKEVKAEARDVGVLRKELCITVPAKVIADHLDHNYSELMHDAIVPGFRKGRAPRQLVEKRFGAEVRESLTTSIIGQSFFATTDNLKLEVLGDPLFQIAAGDEGTKMVGLDEALQHVKLPESGDFVYTCEVEIKPEFELPALSGIEVKTPDVAITDEMVQGELLRQRKLRGRFEPHPDAAAERDDLIVADVTLWAGEEKVKTEENVQVGVRPTRLDGIPLPKLDEALTGVRVGQTVSVDCTIADDYERTDLRGKAGRFEFKVHELKRLVPQAIDEFLQTAGFDKEQDALDYFRMMMENERDQMIARAKQDQVCAYLLDNTKLDVPEQLSARQTDRAVLRRMVELRQRGVPEGDLEAHLDELRTSAQSEVARDLKLSFILEKVAEQLDLQVTDEEINTEIAQIARRYNRRFDRVRDDLRKQDLLPQLAERIRHDKCISRLLEDAALVEVKSEEEPETADKKSKPRRKKAEEKD